MSLELLSLLERLLGQSFQKNKGNYAFYCPNCKHYKPKLEVNFESQSWHCWVCGVRGKVLYNLLRLVNANASAFEELNRLKLTTRSTNTKPQKVEAVKLPQEYIPLWVKDKDNFYWKTCIEYLYSRGVTLFDIIKYRIGYCIDGYYSNMMIFPNYDNYGHLTFFSTRTFLRRNPIKFINPKDMSRNVVGYEMQLNPTLPLILVESALDAIVIKRNSSPLYGTNVQDNLKLWILDNDVKDLYLCLDNDALKKSIDHAKYFMNNGINVYFTELPAGGDPNKLGYDKMWNIIENTEKLTESQLFKYQINSLLSK